MKNNYINFNFLKLALKAEFRWFVNSKRTILLTVGGLFIPFVIFLPGNDIEAIKFEMSPIVFIFLGLAACYGQYFYDSICKDIINKINLFYSNLNISIMYSFIAKMIICLPFFAMIFIVNSYLSLQISFLLIGIYIAYVINVSICSYIIVNFLFDPKSTFFSLYAPLVYDLLLAVLLAKIGIAFMSLFLELVLIIIGIFILKKIFSLKKITTRMF